MFFGLTPRLALASSPENSVESTSDTEEVGYDELVRRLNAKTSRKLETPAEASDFDKLKMYADFAFVTSYNSTTINGGSDMSTGNGFQLGAGIDLFSSEWIGKGVFRNFGQSYTGTRYRSSREFDLEVVYHKDQFHIGGGLGTRYLRVSDAQAAVNIDDATPVSVLVAGLDLPLSQMISLVIEMGWRSAIVTSTSDKNSIDGVFGLSAQF